MAENENPRPRSKMNCATVAEVLSFGKSFSDGSAMERRDNRWLVIHHSGKNLCRWRVLEVSPRWRVFAPELGLFTNRQGASHEVRLDRSTRSATRCSRENNLANLHHVHHVHQVHYVHQFMTFAANQAPSKTGCFAKRSQQVFYYQLFNIGAPGNRY